MSSVSMAGEHERPTTDRLSLLYGVLFRAREAFAEPTLERHLGLAALVIAIVSFIGAATGAATGGGMLVLSFFTWLGWLLFSWFLLTATLFVVTRWMRPQGEFPALLAGTGLAFMPWVVIGPLAVLGRLGKVGAMLEALGSIAVFIWWVRTVIAAVRGVTGLSAAQSLLAIFVSELVLGIIPLALFVLSVLGLVVVASGS